MVSFQVCSEFTSPSTTGYFICNFTFKHRYFQCTRVLISNNMELRKW